MPEPTAATAAVPRPATLARRLGSLVYEALLLTAILFVAGFFALPLITPGHAVTTTELAVPDLPARVVLFCLLFAVLAWYFVASWSMGRRTLPMKTWRMRLLTHDGAPVPPKTALLRFLAVWIGPLLALAGFGLLHPFGLGAHAIWLIAFGFLWVFVDPERQFLHDRLAGTRLVMV